MVGDVYLKRAFREHSAVLHTDFSYDVHNEIKPRGKVAGTMILRPEHKK
jgi:hypothetical protein